MKVEKLHLTVLFLCLMFLLLSSSLAVAHASGSSDSWGKTVTIKPIADTYVDEKYHWKNKGDHNIMAVWAFGDKYISFIKFDLSTIPSSANIVSAELFLHVVDYSVDSNNPSIIGAHSYSNNSWGEHGLSWDTVDWSALNETATDTTEIYVDKLEYQVWFNWTITEDVESAKGNFLTVVLMAENEIESIFFSSRETSLKPYLNITYSFSPSLPITVKDLNITLTTHRTTYYYKDAVSGNVSITYLNGTAFRGVFILYIRHLTKEVMSTTAWIAIDGFTEFYLSPPVFQFGPGNYTIGISSLSTADGYIIESRWIIFPSVRVEALQDDIPPTTSDDYDGSPVGGIIWENTTWTLENSPYIITDTVQIPANVTLTIEPGVTVTKPTAGDLFLLHGIIYAHGTVDNKIIFDGGGNSKFFNADGSNDNTFLDLDYCIIRNGYSFWWGGPGHFNLTHSELTDLTYYSYVWYPGKNVYIEYNKFMNTGGFSIGHHYAVKVYIRYNLFKSKNPNLPTYADFCIQNWASYGESETIVKYNSFIDMDGIVLKLPSGYDSAAMSATENYWGTQDIDVIDSMIYDRNDDINCAGFIEYLPILTEPHPDTPTLPLIVNFTYSPSAPYVYEPVTFDASATFGPYSTIANYIWDFGDGNNITSNTPIVTYTYTMSGGFNVTLTVTDEFGFKNSTTTSVMVLQDDVPPVTTDDYDSEWHVTDFTITLTATDHESGVAETYYRINDGTVKAISTDEQPYITTEDDNNTVEYWSVDNAGNEELPHKILTGIKLDKTAPTIEIPLHIPESAVQPDQEVKVSVNVTDFMSAVKNVTLSHNLNDSAIWIDLPMTPNSTTGLYETIIPGQQANTLVRYTIAAYDNAGNYKVKDNSGQHYVYTVIPEFPTWPLLLLTLILLAAVIILLKKRPWSGAEFFGGCRWKKT